MKRELITDAEILERILEEKKDRNMTHEWKTTKWNWVGEEEPKRKLEPCEWYAIIKIHNSRPKREIWTYHGGTELKSLVERYSKEEV